MERTRYVLKMKGNTIPEIDEVHIEYMYISVNNMAWYSVDGNAPDNERSCSVLTLNVEPMEMNGLQG